MKLKKILVLSLFIVIMATAIVGTEPYRVTKVAGRVSGSPDQYFQDQSLTALTTYYVEQDLGLYSITVVLINDSTNYIEWSWEGTTTNGKLKANENITMDFKTEDGVYVRGEKGSVNQEYRLIAW